MPDFAFKSYCWSIGTTSFRTRNFNKSIEEQLRLLKAFWRLHENAVWEGNNALQEEYYNFIKSNGFVSGDANNKAKDAREKTSGLRDIGLIYSNRQLTEVGEKLLQLSLADNFQSDNIFCVAKDSYIYFKQLLKTTCSVEEKYVRPFIVVIYLLSEFKSLTYEEFMYLAPLCVDAHSLELVSSAIQKLRKGVCTINDTIIEVIMQTENYKEAKSFFVRQQVTESVICNVGMNRKSRGYDAVYFPLYKTLRKVYIEHDDLAIPKLLQDIEKLSPTVKTQWKQYVFRKTTKTALREEPAECLRDNIFTNITTEEELKKHFFDIMHLFKIKATLSDYFDLNRRYINLTDFVVFEDSCVRLDVIPGHYLYPVAKELVLEAFSQYKDIALDSNVEDISKYLAINEEAIKNSIAKELQVPIVDTDGIQSVIERERQKRFDKLIESKFSNDVLLKIFDYISKRDDEKIYELITDEADVPTIFEYVLAITWYKISHQKGNILNFMNLSLQANLLPKTHAGGGQADIIYEYDRSNEYIAHDLLIEATLSEAVNQRKMEMEPVSRHLGRYILNGHKNAYCVFITNKLDPNVISDFRNRKKCYFYDITDLSKHISGMKIIPVEIDDIKEAIKQNIDYGQLYEVFEKAYVNTDIELPHVWFQKCIREKIVEARKEMI